MERVRWIGTAKTLKKAADNGLSGSHGHSREAATAARTGNVLVAPLGLVK